MRNLKLSTELTWNLQLQSENETIQFAAFDIEKNRLFFASSANYIYTTQLPSIHVCTLFLPNFNVYMSILGTGEFLLIYRDYYFIDVTNTPSLLCSLLLSSIYQ